MIRSRRSELELVALDYSQSPVRPGSTGCCGPKLGLLLMPSRAVRQRPYRHADESVRVAAAGPMGRARLVLAVRGHRASQCHHGAMAGYCGPLAAAAATDRRGFDGALGRRRLVLGEHCTRRFADGT